MNGLVGLLNDDTESRLHKIYTADCLGMIVKWVYGVDDFKLYSDYVVKDEKPAETKEQVLNKILGLLDKV